MPDEPPATQPNEREQEMAELGYQPAQILDDDGVILVSYFSKSWSAPPRMGELDRTPPRWQPGMPGAAGGSRKTTAV